MLAPVRAREPASYRPDQPGAKTSYLGYAGGIDSAGVTRIAAAFNHAVNSGCTQISLCFSSMGGYVADGIFLYNLIRALPINVVIHNSGSVSSIAVAVFLAAEERYCSSHAMFMIHPTVIPSQEGMTADHLQSALDAALADDRRTESILRQRANIPKTLLAQRRRSDIHIGPEKAAHYGIVHGVREFALPRGESIVQI